MNIGPTDQSPRSKRWMAAIGLGLALTSCLTATARAETAKVALQFGIGYLPLSVMQAQGLWEKRAKDAGVDLKVEWQNLGNGSAPQRRDPDGFGRYRRRWPDTDAQALG